MKFAVIQTGGKQYLVKSGEVLKIEKISAEGDTVVFDKILLIIDNDKTQIGRPFVEGAKVSAKIIGQGRAKKVNVIRYKSKTRYHKKKGHRQHYTQVKIADY